MAGPMQTPKCYLYRSKIAHQTNFPTIYSITFYGKELTCHEATNLLVCFNRQTSSKTGWLFCLSSDIYIYICLESACHDEQNGDQSFILRARIAELRRFKVHKVENNDEDNDLSFLEAGLWQMSFFECGKELYHFQQELMVSKPVV